MAVPNASSAPSASALCSEPNCRSIAVVQCCDNQNMCALHAHTSKHGQHPQRFKVLDRQLFNNTMPVINMAKQQIIAEIEAELEAEEATLSQASQRGEAQQQGQMSNLSAALPAAPARAKPSLPTFAEIRKRAMENAKKEKQAASASSAAASASASSAAVSKKKRARITAGILLHDDGGDAENSDGGDSSDASSHSEGAGLVTATATLAAAEDHVPAAKRAKHAIEGEQDGGDVNDDAVPAAAAVERTSTFVVPAGIDDRLRESIRKAMAKALTDGLAADLAASTTTASASDNSSHASRLRAILSSEASTSSEAASSSSSSSSSSAMDIADAFLAQKAERELQSVVLLKQGGIELLANGIEGGLFFRVGSAASSSSSSASASGALYRERAREIAAALREPDNSKLRLSLIEGSLAPFQVASIPVQQLASRTVQKVDSHTREQRLITATASDVAGAGASWMPAMRGVKCPSCSAVASGEGGGDDDKRDAGIQYCPARSTVDMRKAETWGGASAEDMVYKFRCKGCGALWFAESAY